VSYRNSLWYRARFGGRRHHIDGALTYSSNIASILHPVTLQTAPRPILHMRNG